MNWRLIRYSENDAYMNMAIDEAISESVAAGGPPTVRFYGWNPGAVSIGYFQSLEKEVDTGACRKEGIDVVRRRTGGGAVFHDRAGEVTYSVTGSETLFPKDIIASYRLICGWVIDSLSLLGIRSEFKPINDIIVEGRKISGNAQTRRGGVLLQHGTILCAVDVERMFRLLRVPDEKFRDKLISSAKERVTSVSEHSGASRAEVCEALERGFTSGKAFDHGQVTPEERTRAVELARSRYSSGGWNSSR
ncbi:MAG: biotin/lipoate A/B protein ligase family protein [Candidatus Micrarchaeia archaeon]